MNIWREICQRPDVFQKHGRDIRKYIQRLDRHNYDMMNIVDYLIGNTDRHWGNWGVLVDNSTNKAKCLHKLMDFNQAFHSYDNMDGANCQTVFCKGVTQKEAAIWAVKRTGLHQIKEVEKRYLRNFRSIMICLYGGWSC